MRTWKQDSFDRAWDYYDDSPGSRLLAFVVQANPGKERSRWGARFIVSKLLAADRDFASLEEAKTYVEAMFALEE